MAYQMAKDTSDLPRPRGGGGGGRADRTVVKMRRRSRSVDAGALSDMSTPNGPPPQPPSHSSSPSPFRGGGYPALVKRGGGGERGHGPPPHPPSSLGGQTPPPPTPLPRADYHLGGGGGATPTPAPRKAPLGGVGGAGTSDTLRRLHTQTSSSPLDDSALNNGSLSPKAMSSSDKKGLIINEIVTTERDYVRDMEMVINVSTFSLLNTKYSETRRELFMMDYEEER
jgi:hypothetical protein